MKLVVSLIIYMIAPFQMMEDISTWIVKTPHRTFSQLKDDRWAMNDSILSIPITMNIHINEQCDTIYVLDRIHDNRTDLHCINVWKNNGSKIITYTDSTVTVHQKSSKSRVYYNLIKSWETDLLRHIGNEAQRNITPSTKHYLARIIFHNGASKVDTVSFYNLGEVERLTKHQLDSLKEMIRQKKVFENIDSTKSENLNDSIPRADTLNNPVKELSSPLGQKSPLSILQRIIDWLLNLWKSIFG